MEFKKFNASKWRKHYQKSCESMTTEELERMFTGLNRFQSIFKEYVKDKFGTGKRETDILEYTIIAADILMKKYRKEREEVPY